MANALERGSTRTKRRGEWTQELKMKAKKPASLIKSGVTMADEKTKELLNELFERAIKYGNSSVVLINQDELDQLRKERNEYRQALEFYANLYWKDNTEFWQKPAREALEKWKFAK